MEAARGAFDASPGEKVIDFGGPAVARYLRFVAVSSQAGDPGAALAEIRVIEAPAVLPRPLSALTGG